MLAATIEREAFSLMKTKVAFIIDHTFLLPPFFYSYNRRSNVDVRSAAKKNS